MEPFVIQRSTLPFRGQELNFQEQLQNFEVAVRSVYIHLPAIGFKYFPSTLISSFLKWRKQTDNFFFLFTSSSCFCVSFMRSSLVTAQNQSSALIPSSHFFRFSLFFGNEKTQHCQFPDNQRQYTYFRGTNSCLFSKNWGLLYVSTHFALFISRWEYLIKFALFITFLKSSKGWNSISMVVSSEIKILEFGKIKNI